MLRRFGSVFLSGLSLGLTLGLALQVGWARAAPQPLVMLVDASIDMPWAQFAGHEVVGGIHFDMASALAASLHRPVKLEQMARRRLAEKLESGEGDLVCASSPEWLPGNVAWSVPFMSSDDVVVTRKDVQAVKSVDDLLGHTLGTIAGFAYPELEKRLSPGFVRDDAPNMISNLRKLSMGRVVHAVVNQRSLMYLQRTGAFKLPIQKPLVAGHNQTGCALSRQSSLSLGELNASIQALTKDGTWERINAKYR